MKTINDYVRQITEWAHRKGWDEPRACETPGTPHANTAPVKPAVHVVGTKLALVHSEVSEALEEVRKGPEHYAIRFEEVVDKDGTPRMKPEGVAIEMADAVIRIFHLAGMLGLDLEGAIEAKLAYNERRPFRHGGKAV